MVYAPVLITTMNRYEHFVRCVESLKLNEWAKYTELIIGLDYPTKDEYKKDYNRIGEYIKTISGFEKVTCFAWETNVGPSENYLKLREYATKTCDRYIFTEDDNVFSPCFIEYMDRCLEQYEDDDRVLEVCGYSELDIEEEIGTRIYPYYVSSAWGVGHWKNKEDKVMSLVDWGIWKSWSKRVGAMWRLIHKSPRSFGTYMRMIVNDRKDELWLADYLYSIVFMVKDYYSIRPSCSLVRNEGYDGSGVICKADNLAAEKIMSQRISQEKLFEEDFQIDYMSRKVKRKSRKALWRQRIGINRKWYVAAWLFYALGMKRKAQKMING